MIVSGISLAGRTAVVTGGAGAIGSAFVAGLLKAGANVAAVDVSAKGLQALANGVKDHANRFMPDYFLGIGGGAIAAGGGKGGAGGAAVGAAAFWATAVGAAAGPPAVAVPSAAATGATGSGSL